ncbi:uncharacterized protein LOC101454408 isoform X1 [Ceratitis capitata]|uniref:uncharacterized protein LOC101454408 isoform X1 n=1 Tax=Ceratitis capitata TaxID=7213 RepID=UPI00061896FC|nr:uncharacterized protein LOC101454408 isoform X1 [Ceratitis capitata]
MYLSATVEITQMTTTTAATTKTTTTTWTTKHLLHRILNIYILFNIFYGVAGREAVTPSDDVESLLKCETEAGVVVMPMVYTTARNNAPPCLIDTQRDLPKPNLPQPLYLRPNSSEYWLPNDEGYLEVPHGSSIELVCTGAFANITGTSTGISQRTRIIRPRCIQGTTFSLNGDKYEFQQFLCTKSVKYTVERTAQTCANHTAQLYRVGYNVTTKGRFVETMHICHDDDELRTHYVRYTLVPGSVYFQPNVKRLSFSKAQHFSAYNMNQLYSQKNQRLKAAQLLNTEPEALAYALDAKSLYLSRGHLAAKADMIYATQQRTTYTFFNAAPQWQSFNGGQWATVENKVRAFVAKKKRSATCFTGTVGTMHLKSADANVRLPFYLAADANNNGLLPVPALYYRIIVMGYSAGIVLLGVNDPHATVSEILTEYVICQDVREQVPWLSWMRNGAGSLRRGYLYACRVDEFIKVVPALPVELGNVTELLL